MLALGSLITKDKLPLFFDYLDRMKQDKAVQKSYLTPETHLAYLNSYLGGNGGNYGVAVPGVTIYTKRVD